MLIHRRPDWYLPEAAATPEALWRARPRRRTLLAGAVGALPLLAAGRARADAPAPSPLSTPTTRPKIAYPPGRPITPKADATTYNNFYEFGESKDVVDAAQALKTTPWAIEIRGLVAKEQTIPIDDLVRRMPMQDRVLRHRCVEAWAMTVPWTGFPLAALVALANPASNAKYVAFTSAAQPDMPGLAQSFYPWPYTEGLAMDEAMNDLAFMATGMYGAPVPKQDGAPIRLLVPWKYGFKSAKSITRLTFVEKQPDTFWETLGPSEYGFWANVNPAVPHPRWSQAQERLLGTGEMVPTVIYNGYGADVASLYAGRTGVELFR